MKTALITGVTGQDGAYLSLFLLEKGYRVFGTYRNADSVDFWRIEELGIRTHQNLNLVEHDLTDSKSTIRLLEMAMPDEVYNLAAQSFVGVSFEHPKSTTEITGVGVLNMLEAIRKVNSKIRFYQASSSEMYGKIQETPQTESTPFYPRSPYGVAKLYAYWMTIIYRESYDIFGASGILFNHESPLRGQNFVTRKITNSIARIKLGLQDVLELGNLEAKRDWGYAKEYVEGMYLMLQADNPETFVLATNRTQSIRDFVNMSCLAAGISIEWSGSNEKEVGINKDNGKVIIKINPKYYRPNEVDLVIGDASKAKDLLGWQAKTTLEELCGMMLQADLNRNKLIG